MHLDLRTLEPGTALDADLCVIGAGVAGITLARRFLGRNVSVVLLESGGLDYEPSIQAMAAGDNVGFGYYALEDSRLRLFGGTTAIWGGRVAALDDIDFEHRPWVPWSGWPLSRRDLDPWYEQALAELDLPLLPLDEQLFPRMGLDAPAFDPGTVRVAFWLFDPQADRYTAPRCRDLWEAGNIRVLTHATVTRIQAAANGQTITHVDVAEPGGKQGRVRARTFVLAAGGIENPRLLLASDDVHRNGLGNEHDLVGRFFMEHPHARGGRIRLTRPWWMLRRLMYRHRVEGTTAAACLRPGEALQQRAGILNTSFAFGCRQHPGARMSPFKQLYQAARHELEPTRTNRRLWQAYKRTRTWLRERLDPLLPCLVDRLDLQGIYAVVRAEQAPNPDSRVRLGHDQDALGVRRAVLDWQISELDKHSVRVTMEAFDTELRRLGLGHVEIPDWLRDEGMPWQVDPLVSGHPIGGFHHMGTTRMAASAEQGVVDPDGRVFGLANLYVAGSSVFPTSGWANPTLTLVALTLRLAEHLRGKLGVSEWGREVA